MAGIFYLKNKKYHFWQIFDLAAAPLALFLSIYNLGFFLKSEGVIGRAEFFKDIPNAFYLAILFFVLFWVLKRLEKHKRHIGYFASFFLVSFALLFLSSFYLGKIGLLTDVVSEVLFGMVSYHEIFAGAFLLFGGVSWYILAKRRVPEDTKGLLALFLLILFRAKRVVTSIGEADQIAKAVVLLPYNVAKFVFAIVRAIGKEIISSFLDFAHTLGIKK